MTEKNCSEDIEILLRRLAFGSVSDAVKLLLRSETLSDRQIKNLDLFCLTNVKRTGNGISEIKLCDRLKAIEMLRNTGREETTGNGFIEALMKGADALTEDKDDESTI